MKTITLPLEEYEKLMEIKNKFKEKEKELQEKFNKRLEEEKKEVKSLEKSLSDKIELIHKTGTIIYSSAYFCRDKWMVTTIDDTLLKLKRNYDGLKQENYRLQTMNDALILKQSKKWF